MNVPGRTQASPEGKIEANIWMGFGKSKFFLKHLKTMEVDGTKTEFVFAGQSYTIDLDYCSKFNKNKIPILDYSKGHSIPIRLSIDKDELPDKDSSIVFNEIFNLGILKAILASATRLTAQSPIWLPILAGTGIGFIVAVVLGHFGFLGSVIDGTSGTSVAGR